jgi:membrane protease subunit (stomatin/prohibitin family)
MATAKGFTDRVFDALEESSQALVGRATSGTERVHRITASLIKEAEWTQQGALELGRKFVQNPLDIAGLSTAAFQKSGEAQNRGFEVARQMVEELSTSAQETRETVQQIAQAGVQASWPAIEAVRGFVTRTGEALRPEFLRTETPARNATATRVRRATEEAA